MGKCSSLVLVAVLLALAAALPGCSGSGAKITNFPIPANILLSPAPELSIDIGAIQTFTAIAQNSSKTTITTPIFFASSNTAVVTIAANGLACAGTWNSLTVPTVCTPGSTGIALVTATAQGVSSPPTTVYVHQHIDHVTLGIPTTEIPPSTPCFSKDQVFDYEATAYSGTNPPEDITATVGKFTWQAVTANVATISNTVTGLLPNQVQITATTPGVTSFFANVSNVTSPPMFFVTCPVQKISLLVNGNSTETVTFAKGGSATITPTVTDSIGNVITGVPLTWNTSQPASVTVSTTGVVSGPAAGGAAVTASCTPSTCNIGFLPTLPVYAENSINVVVTGTGTPQTESIYVTSKDCGTTDGCTSLLLPITAPANAVGNPITLPATPNSLVFDRQGKNAYLGTDFGEFGAKGLMVLNPTANPPSISEFVSTPGTVLAVSPDGKKVIVSDTTDTPNQVFIFDTGTHTPLTLAITGATAADFSPDSLKAFIVSSTGSTSTLYVYSLLDALAPVQLSGTVGASEAAFLPSGNFGYVAMDAPFLTILPTFNDPALLGLELSTATTIGTPLMIRPVPDGSRILALDPPGIDLVTPTITGDGCSFSRPYPSDPSASISGTLAVSNTSTFFNLGQVDFIPTLIISPDSSTAYMFTSNLSSILVFSIVNQTSSAIPLTGGAIPVQAALTPDGVTLYVAASDGAVHVIDTVSAGDIQQLTFPTNPSTLLEGLCIGVTTVCNPNLIAVKP
jgi:hypothetical protein